MKPIVQIFKTINSHYVYDGVRCEVLEISKQSVEYLKRVLSGIKI